ncbi:MAG TPA: hydrogenase/urease maturation nickel metallochaperone HypA [Acidimicrobiales bacterium]|nr:hydrogenase/urease maturation nickel metallochaperone HypA [Acidimicrobiales bacterium]
MHELSLVEELVAACRQRAGGKAICRVVVRCPESLDVEELTSGFALAAKELAARTGDSCLARAELKVTLVPVDVSCACGYKGRPGADYLAGHMAICPACGHVGEAEAGLELVSMSFSNGVEPFGPT